MVSWIEGFDGIVVTDRIGEIDEIEVIDAIENKSNVPHSPSDIIKQQPELLLPDADRIPLVQSLRI